MGFKAYHAALQDEQIWRLERPEPLRFSGTHGLVAQWFRKHRLDVGDDGWIVPAQDWLTMAFGEAGAANRWIIFEQADGPVQKLARMDRIHGKFGSAIRLMFQFRPLQMKMVGGHIQVTEPANACGWSEELSLDGGTSSTCTWRWRAPQLGFASVTAGSGVAQPAAPTAAG
jgi:hypothetical protein